MKLNLKHLEKNLKNLGNCDALLEVKKLIPEFGDKLRVDQVIVEKATKLAEEFTKKYGCPSAYGKRPSVFASACVYLASYLIDPDNHITQSKIYKVLSINPNALRKMARYIAYKLDKEILAIF